MTKNHRFQASSLAALVGLAACSDQQGSPSKDQSGAPAHNQADTAPQQYITCIEKQLADKQCMTRLLEDYGSFTKGIDATLLTEQEKQDHANLFWVTKMRKTFGGYKYHDRDVAGSLDSLAALMMRVAFVGKMTQDNVYQEYAQLASKETDYCLEKLFSANSYASSEVIRASNQYGEFSPAATYLLLAEASKKEFLHVFPQVSAESIERSMNVYMQRVHDDLVHHFVSAPQTDTSTEVNAFLFPATFPRNRYLYKHFRIP